MVEVGYKIASEEHGPNDLVRYSAMAEEAGFTFGSISDHIHPWIDKQGHSPFVWAVLGGIARATTTFRIGTGVTCPTIRIHPAVIAHAAATAGVMLEGRFFLGLGTGENLNEHVLGDRWPNPAVRREMLAEAIEVIRELWEGGFQNHRGTYYTVENARIYDLPEQLPSIYLAAGGDEMAELAGEVADGLIALTPDDHLINVFRDAGGGDKPRYTEVQVCYHADQAQAKKIVHEQWPNAGIKGELAMELPLPRHFEQAAEMVSEDDAAGSTATGPDPEVHLEHLRRYIDAGYTHLAVHQIGPDQESFFRFYSEEILPKLA